ncbi:hypothetical protein LAC02_45990 [Ligilactobacillus acidipiscis]|nr:hypothetical protein LAC02_45990 [Ligilactobacillus acidipiscis]
MNRIIKKQLLNQECGSCGLPKPYSAKEYTMRINLIGQLDPGKSFMLNLLVCCGATAILFMRPLTVATESVVWLMFTGSFLKRPKEITEPKDR